MKSKVLGIEQFVIDTVRDRRNKVGLTQSELADILNVSAGFIGKVESAKYSSKYNLSHIQKLSQFFKCSPQVFLPKKINPK